MRVNGIDVRKYGAKLLTVEEQPPQMAVSKDWISRALLPTEYETDIPLGSLKLTIYFRADNRAQLQRQVSRFMMLFRESAVLDEIKGYKGKYKAYLTDDSLTKTLNLSKKILELSADGYFFDDEEAATFDGKTSGYIYPDGSRRIPCEMEITAKSDLKDFAVTLNGEDYEIEELAKGKTLIISGTNGTATIDGTNAFGSVNMWQFPRLEPDVNSVIFSNNQAAVTFRWTPVWI